MEQPRRKRDAHAPSAAAPAEQRADAESSWPVFGSGLLTHAMAKGAIIWMAVGLVAGAVIGALVALVPMGGLAFGTRLWVLALCGAIAGATAGALWGGGRQPELEDEVGNEARAPGLFEVQRDPAEARRYVEQMKRARRAESRSRPRQA